jgi:hypothetical protein
MSEPGRSPPADEPTIDLPSPDPAAHPVVRVEFAAGTDVGRVRKNNEDHHLIARLSKTLRVLRTDLPRGDAPRVWDEEGYLLAVAGVWQRFATKWAIVALRQVKAVSCDGRLPTRKK